MIVPRLTRPCASHGEAEARQKTSHPAAAQRLMAYSRGHRDRHSPAVSLSPAGAALQASNPRPTSTRHPWRGPGMPSRPYSNPYRVRPYSGLISGRKVWQATMHLAGRRRQTNMAVLIPKGQAYAAAIGGAPDPPPTSRPKLRRPRAGSLQGSADDDHRHSVFSKMSRVHKEHSVMEKSIQSDQRYASKPRNSLSPPTSSPTVMKPRHRAAPGCSASGTGPPPPAASS